MSTSPPPGWKREHDHRQLPDGLARYRWWHRLAGHHTRSRYDLIRYDLIGASYAWECYECDLCIGHL